MSQQRWLTAREAAIELRLSTRTIHELIRRGSISSVKVGRARRIPASAIDEYEARLLSQESK